MNWGWGIALAYSTFVAFMLGMVALAVNQDFDLVADDYYEQEIAYQDRIDQLTNASVEGIKVTYASDGERYRFTFPANSTKVKVCFFRPSDDALDHCASDFVAAEPITVPRAKLAAGRYLLKLEWMANGTKYFQEDDIVVN